MAVKPKLPGTMGSPTEGTISDMGSTKNDIGDKSGFQTTGYIVKKGVPYGEGAKFNVMPPGMDIDNQPDADIRDLPMKEIVDTAGYSGDGWE